MIINKFVEIFMSRLPAGYRNTRKCIEINCPACIYMGERRADTKLRGGFFNRGSEVGYNCFNCGFKFRAKEDLIPNKAFKFLELLGADKTDINELHFLAMRTSPFGQTYKTKKSADVPKIKIDFKDVSLPKGTHLLHDIIKDAAPDSDAFAAYVYAKQRGVEQYPYLMWTDNKRDHLNKRLILPYLFRDQIVGFNARLFDQTIKGADRFYEINPNENFVFNMDSIYKDRKILIINESPYDSLLFDGVSTMGTNITKPRADIINQFKGRKILVPDLDESGMKAVDIALKNNWEVYFPTWSYRYDMGEAVDNFGRIFVLMDILKNATSDHLDITIKKNLI